MFVPTSGCCGTNVSCGGSAFNVGRGSMPALFAYLLAVSLLVGSGYVSLHWLTAPPDVGTNQRPHRSKSPPASKDVGEKYGPLVPAATRAENRSDDHSEMEITASSPASKASNKDTIEVPPNGTGVAKKTPAFLPNQPEMYHPVAVCLSASRQKAS